MQLRIILTGLALLGAAAASGSCGSASNGNGNHSTGSGSVLPDGGVGSATDPDGGPPSLGPSSEGDGGCADHAPGCPCTLGQSVACWTGPAADHNVGACKDGTQTCEGAGEFPEWGPCVGEVLDCTVDAGPPVPSPTTDSCARMALTYIDTQFPATVCMLTPTGGVKCAQTGTYANGIDEDAGGPPPGLTGVQCISGGEDFFCVVTATGGVTCWGDSAAFDPAKDQFGAFSGAMETLAIPGLPSGIIDIAAGETHTCVLTSTGTVMCWGDGIGEINTGSWPLSAAPTAVAGIGLPVISIASGDGFSCALRNDGTVMCWGNNTGGELGDGTTTMSATPVLVKGLPSPAIGIWADQATHPCALLKDGSTWCWGTTDESGGATSPVQVAGLTPGVVALTTGGEESMSCALLANTGVECWGSFDSDPAQSGAGVFSVLPPGAGAIGLRSIDDDFCVLLTDGGVDCWGSDPGIPTDGGGAPTPIPGL